jgi:hypothetical protein
MGPFLEMPVLQHECDAYVHLNAFPLGTRVTSKDGGGYIPIGFFQMWCPAVSGVCEYPVAHTDAGRGDMVFAKMWPRAKRGLIPEVVGYHLESTDASMSANWYGRKTAPFTHSGGPSMSHIVPSATQRFLTSYGGKNPFGKPQWRLLVGSDRLVKESGVYRDWAPGLSTAEKGGLNFQPNPDAPGCNFSRHDNRPLRVVTEMREVKKYPHARVDSGEVVPCLELWHPGGVVFVQGDRRVYSDVGALSRMW